MPSVYVAIPGWTPGNTPKFKWSQTLIRPLFPPLPPPVTGVPLAPRDERFAATGQIMHTPARILRPDHTAR